MTTTSRDRDRHQHGHGPDGARDLTVAAEAARRAERERRLALLESVAGVSHAPTVATDEGTVEVLVAEVLHRHG